MALGVVCCEESARRVEAFEIDDLESFRAILVALLLARWQMEQEEQKYLLKRTFCFNVPSEMPISPA